MKIMRTEGRYSNQLNFRDENRNNMELMSTQERQAFIDNMNSSQGMGQGVGGGRGRH